MNRDDAHELRESTTGEHGFCPNCLEAIAIEELAKKFQIKHCPYCGQKLDTPWNR
jgi:NMD protein affecting ribosome stability and mRNA decay